MKNADMPAMPVFNSNGAFAQRPVHYSTDDGTMSGLTKREAMAMHLMQGILAAGNTDDFVAGDDVGFAGFAVSCADALLAELERTK